MVIAVGIAGGTASGKSTLAEEIVAQASASAVLLSLDRYYVATPKTLGTTWNYDHPKAIDWDLLLGHVAALLRGEAIEAPVYAFDSHIRSPRRERLGPAELVVVEGLHALGCAALRSVFSVAVYVDAPEALRLQWRITRDVQERGRSAASVERQYREQVEPMHRRYVHPTKRFADQVISGERDLALAAAEIVRWVQTLPERA